LNEWLQNVHENDFWCLSSAGSQVALFMVELYASMTYKNSVDIMKFVKQYWLLTFTLSKLDENETTTQKEVWRIHANNTIK